jgi:hypothetical protein
MAFKMKGHTLPGPYQQKRTGPKDQSKNDPNNLGLGTTVTNPGAEVPGSPEVTTTKWIKGANPKSYSDLHNMPVPVGRDGKPAANATKEEKARFERWQASEKASSPAKQGFKPSKIKDSDKITGTKTSKTGKKSVKRKGDTKPGGLKTSKSSPAKWVQAAAQLAPMVMGALGNKKKEE